MNFKLGVSKNRGGFYPKMDGENNGKNLLKDDLGGFTTPIFGNTQINFQKKSNNSHEIIGQVIDTPGILDHPLEDQKNSFNCLENSRCDVNISINLKPLKAAVSRCRCAKNGGTEFLYVLFCVVESWVPGQKLVVCLVLRASSFLARRVFFVEGYSMIYFLGSDGSSLGSEKIYMATRLVTFLPGWWVGRVR